MTDAISIQTIRSTHDLMKVVFSPSPDPGLMDVCGLQPSRFLQLYMGQFLHGKKLTDFDSSNMKGRLNEMKHKDAMMREAAREMEARKDKLAADLDVGIYSDYEIGLFDVNW